MIARLVDFFPFNIAAGPQFLVFFAVLSVGVLIVVNLVRGGLGRVLDKRADERFILGSRRRMPKTEDCLLVAQLEGDAAWPHLMRRRSRRAVGPPRKDKATFTFGGQHPRRAAARSFHDSIAGVKKTEVDATTVQAAAKETARDQVGRLDQELAAAGMVRSAQTLWALRLVVFAGGGFLMLVGLIRILRAVELGRPFSLLLVEMLVVAVIPWRCFGSAGQTLKKITSDWLDKANTSLQATDSGRRKEAQSGLTWQSRVPGSSPPLYEI